jgi:hypothetical protein
MSRSIQLVQLRAAIHPTASQLRPTLVLFARFDETGTHAGSSALGILGLIGNEAAWTDAEQKWVARKGEDGVDTFHTYDCKTHRGEFSGPEWEQPRRDRLLFDLASIIGQSDLSALGFMVLTKDWNEISDPIFKKRYQTAYHFCFEAALLACVQWSEQFANNEQVAVVFAQHDQYEKFSAILSESLLKVKMLKGVTSITFSTPEKMVALQLADMTANLNGEYFSNKPKLMNKFCAALDRNGAKRPRELMKFFDAKSFEKIVKQFSNPDERFSSRKLDNYLAKKNSEKEDKRIRKQRVSWGLLPTVKAAVERFRPRKKK